VRVGYSSFGVEVQHLPERLEAPIVRVGSAAGKIAQSGYFEFPEISAPPGDGFAPRVGIQSVHSDPQVGELLRGEVGTGVAFGAFAFAIEEIEAILLLLAESRLVAGEVAIVRGVSGNYGALEGSDGLRDAIEVDGAVSEGSHEKRGIAFNSLEGLNDPISRHAHLVGIRHRHDDLRLQCGGTAVPEL